MGNNSNSLAQGEVFLNRTQMAQALRSIIEKWDLMKLENFCKAKDIVNKTNWQPIDWEKIFTNPTSVRGLMSKIYKELKEVTSKNKQTNKKTKKKQKTKNQTTQSKNGI